MYSVELIVEGRIVFAWILPAGNRLGPRIGIILGYVYTHTRYYNSIRFYDSPNIRACANPVAIGSPSVRESVMRRRTCRITYDTEHPFNTYPATYEEQPQAKQERRKCFSIDTIGGLAGSH
jgi:hypothetical protein